MFTGDAFERAEVEVPLYRTKLGAGTGVGGGRKGYVTEKAAMLDKSGTAVNVGVNAQVGWTMCEWERTAFSPATGVRAS
ncbi:hypothetical protein ACIRU8_10530 [Streptomyces sp. NPDC101175]|uniref:hypothetical protein n=1 Tax=Streptomyces sp. NPDC101175 TaxID=3366123 RepID=UPI00383545F1